MTGWLKRFRVILGVIAFALIIWSLRRYLSEIDWRLFYRNPGRLTLAILATLINIASQFWIWLSLVNRNGPRLDWNGGYQRYCASWISRYLPVGKVWQFVALIESSDSPSLRMHCIGSMFLSIFCGIIGGIVLVCLGQSSLPYLHAKPIVSVIGLCACVAAAYGLSRDPVLHWLGRPFRVFQASGVIFESIRFSKVIEVISIQFIFCWVAEGLAILLMISMAQDVPLNFRAFWPILAGYALSGFSGYAFPFTPTGLGIREGVWFFFLKTQTTLPAAAVVVIGMRVLNTLGDLLFISPFIARLLRRQRDS